MLTNTMACAMGMHIALTHAELINNIDIEIQVVVVSVAVRSLPLSLSLSPRGLQILSSSPYVTNVL